MPAEEIQVNPGFGAAFARLRQSAFVRNMLIVMSGSAVAQVTAFMLSPVISRLFSPANFGVFGSFNAVLLVITAGVTLDYSQAIMLPKEKSDAMNLMMASCLSTMAVGVACLTACLIAPSFFLGLMKSPNAWFLALLVLAVIVGGLNQTLQAWCVRVKAFKRTSASQVVRGVTVSGMQVGLGFLKVGAPGLIVSSVLADFCASLNLLRSVIPDFLANRHVVHWKRVRQLAHEYRDFPMYSAFQNVVNAMSSGLPVLLLAHYYGIAVAGTYAFAAGILSKPMGLVTNSLRQVLFQKASETQHQGGSLTALYFKTTAVLFAIGFLPSLVLMIWAPQLFNWVFGVPWLTAGEFARWLVLWLLFAFCNLPAVLFARLIRIQRAVLFYDLALLAARSFALVLGGLYFSPGRTVFFFSLIGAIMNFILILLVGHAVRRKEQTIEMPATL